MEKTAAPQHLSERSQALWRSVLQRHELEDEHLVTLELALAALDRADAARELLARDGLTIRGAHGGLAAHPAITIERDSRIAVMRGLRQLGLDLYDDPGPQPRDEAGRFGRTK